MNQRRSTKETSVMSNLWISSFLIALNVFFLKSVALGFTLCRKMIAIERTLENQGLDLFLEQRVLYANHGSNKSRKSANCQTFLKKRKLPVIKLVNRNSIIK